MADIAYSKAYGLAGVFRQVISVFLPSVVVGCLVVALVYADKVCRLVLAKPNAAGILCCGTGIGMSMAANKFIGIRAAVVSDPFSAEMTRRHNNANVLCLGGRVISAEQALTFAELFLNTPFDGGRHQRRVDMISEIEKEQRVTS